MRHLGQHLNHVRLNVKNVGYVPQDVGYTGLHNWPLGRKKRRIK